MMPECKQLLALAHEDGTVSVMQIFADVDAETEISRSAFASPVTGFRSITQAEAAAIRTQRPKPERSNLSSSDGVNVQITEGGPDYLPILEAMATKLEELSERNAQLESNVGTLNAVIDAIADKAREQSHEDQ